jgi:hypothetical protein
MSDSSLNLKARPVSLARGVLVGLVAGPVIGALLFHAPSSEWLGPYPDESYALNTTVGMVIVGLGCGAPVGFAVALVARIFQSWRWGGDVRALNPGPRWQPPEDRTAGTDDQGITRRTDAFHPPEEGMAPAE